MLTVSICGAAHSGQPCPISYVLTVKKVGHSGQDQFSSFVNDQPARISAAIPSRSVARAAPPCCLPNAGAGYAALVNDQTAWQRFRSNGRP